MTVEIASETGRAYLSLNIYREAAMMELKKGECCDGLL
jgi:hypothetical protein